MSHVTYPNESWHTHSTRQEKQYRKRITDAADEMSHELMPQMK